MKLYIKQRIFSLRDKYHVWDETGTPVFYVEGEVFTLGAKIHIYDMTGQNAFSFSRKCSGSSLNMKFIKILLFAPLLKRN